MNSGWGHTQQEEARAPQVITEQAFFQCCPITCQNTHPGSARGTGEAQPNFTEGFQIAGQQVFENAEGTGTSSLYHSFFVFAHKNRSKGKHSCTCLPRSPGCFPPAVHLGYGRIGLDLLRTLFICRSKSSDQPITVWPCLIPMLLGLRKLHGPFITQLLCCSEKLHFD